MQPLMQLNLEAESVVIRVILKHISIDQPLRKVIDSMIQSPTMKRKLASEYPDVSRSFWLTEGLTRVIFCTTAYGYRIKVHVANGHYRH